MWLTSDFFGIINLNTTIETIYIYIYIDSLLLVSSLSLSREIKKVPVSSEETKKGQKVVMPQADQSDKI